MPRDSETAKVSSDAKIVLVTLVHGTFARGTAWTQAGSSLRERIADALKVSVDDVLFDVFEWSGRNTHKARIKAGHELATHIEAVRKSLPKTIRHFIIAHSHGGNVALFAHKHLPAEFHALGIATLGTPFVYARLEEAIRDKSLEQLLEDAPRHSDNITGVFSWAAGIFGALMADGFLEGTRFDEFYWAIGSGIAIGMLGSILFGVLYPYVARAWHMVGGRRAAVILAEKVRFPELPNTHVLSFIYPRDEARVLLDALEATTALPSRPIRWIRSIASPGLSLAFFGLFVLGFATAIAEEFVTFDGEAMGDMIGEWFAFVIVGMFFLWLALVTVRYMLSFLRGHPWGFGWERPSIHSHVEIGIEPEADLPDAKSYLHQEVPFSAHAPKSGMRHVGLYEDRRILQALSYWMAHVR